MPVKKENEVLDETLKQMQYLWRHRSGFKTLPQKYEKVPLLGKFVKEVRIDNTIPGLILDTIDNLGLVTKDGRKPVIVPGGQRKTEYGWYLVFNLPPGITFSMMDRRREYFSNAVKGWVDLEWKDGYCHVDVQVGTLPKQIDFTWDPTPYLDKMILPFPVGVTRKGPLVWDLAGGGAPHLLGGGATGTGKTNEDMVLIHSFLMLPPERVKVCVIDRKGVDFRYLKNHLMVVEEEDDARQMLESLWRQHHIRKKECQRVGVKKIQKYNKICPDQQMPYIVCVIDEFAELQDDRSLVLIDKLVRMSRAMGIHLIASTQRPSFKKMDTDTRSQFDLRLCFPVASEIDSRMILGEANPEAARLERVPGRALFRVGMDLIEVQTYELTDEKAEELLQSIGKERKWTGEFRSTRLLPR
jgi:S-DNA-T family DNA segregation ATPase FtsK/SpoIIIE